ncbi:MAG: hypothetical protein FJ296_11010 [Planctomycetes bacterium]|nr:hypothetical protein [Planctomycetota bacterium]
MPAPTTTILRSLLALLAACTAPGALPPHAAPADLPPHGAVLVFLRSGEAAASMSPEQRQEVQAAHMANIGRLAQAGQIAIAGPMGRDNPDPSVRGLFVFDVPGVAEAEALTRTDPAVQADVLRLEAHPLQLTADLRALNARDLADEAARQAEGRSFLEGMRTYVLAIAHDAARAGPALDASPTTCLAARFGGEWSGRAFYVLDAPDLAAGRALLQPAGDLGPVDLYPWFGSANVARMRDG